ncbi:MAG: hypothetical protein N3D10_04195, partial [Candidatus Micrarchaeota archaeon]|nr:hypothetical protein [Candidatus Micrarchaeota archaeon]
MLKKKDDKQSDEDFIRNLKEYPNTYFEIDKDRLVLFVVDFLSKNNIEPTFDKIVAAAFKLFPKKFCLIGFPEYPDAKVINDCVFLHCVRTRGWLMGNAQSGYRITDKGKYYVDGTQMMLEGKITIEKKYSLLPKRKEVTFINKLKKSKAYQKYIKNEMDKIKDFEIKEALLLTDNEEKKFIEHW